MQTMNVKGVRDRCAHCTTRSGQIQNTISTALASDMRLVILNWRAIPCRMLMNEYDFAVPHVARRQESLSSLAQAVARLLQATVPWAWRPGSLLLSGMPCWGTQTPPGRAAQASAVSSIHFDDEKADSGHAAQRRLAPAHRRSTSASCRNCSSMPGSTLTLYPLLLFIEPACLESWGLKASTYTHKSVEEGNGR